MTLLRVLDVDGYRVSEVEFRPDDGFPLCLGYMVGDDDGVSKLWTTPCEAIRKHRDAEELRAKDAAAHKA